MKGGSLKRRVLATGAASILVALAVAGLGLLLLFERHVERRMDLELEARLRQLVDGLGRGPDGGLRVERLPAEPRFLEPGSGLYWQIGSRADGALLRSRSLGDARLELPADALADGEVHRHDISGPGRSTLHLVERAVAAPNDPAGARLRAAVAVDRAEIHAAGRAFAADLVPFLMVLAAVLTAAAWAQAAIGLRPLDAVRLTLADVRAGRRARLGAEFPDEVRPLAAEVDHLLDARDEAVARARSRAADLAHGLKTPLTVLASDVEELRARGQAEIADEIAGVADGMRRHVERELARARAGGRARLGAVRPIAPVVERVVAVLRRTPRGHALEWRIDIPADLHTPADDQDLAEIVGNLAENAVEWAARDIRVAARARGEAVALRVEDDGPGVPEDRIGEALARGGRLDEQRPGSGLGLAIAGDLVEAYGGALELGRSELGGLLVEARLPLARRPS